MSSRRRTRASTAAGEDPAVVGPRRNKPRTSPSEPVAEPAAAVARTVPEFTLVEPPAAPVAEAGREPPVPAPVDPTSPTGPESAPPPAGARVAAAGANPFEVIVDFFRMMGAENANIQFTTFPIGSVGRDGFPVNPVFPQPDAEYQREQAASRARLKADTEKRETNLILDGFKNEADIAAATVKELKRVLEANCVDHSSCVEKADLLAKVAVVWNDRGGGAAADADKGKAASAPDGACKICFDEGANTVFADCGHLVSCHTCAQKVDDCPVCRKPITNRVRVFRA